MGESAPNEGEAPVIVSLAEAAMHMYTAAIDSLPFPEDKKFHKRADVVLSGLRKISSPSSRLAGGRTATVIRSICFFMRDLPGDPTRLSTFPSRKPGRVLPQW